MRDDDRAASKPAADLLQRVLQSGRTLLTEAESKRLLAAYDIPTVETASATSAAEAVQCAEKNWLSGRRKAVVEDDHAQDRRRRR